MFNSKICIVSGHYPEGVFFTELTKRVLIQYSKVNKYDLYYDSHTEVEHIVSEFHFRRCLVIKKASEVFPNAEWYVWLDTDIYIKRLDRRIEEFIDLSQDNMLYHLFHEEPWEFPINTGVKFVNRDALTLEEEIYSMRSNCPFPYEQKIMADYIFPKYKNQIIIHNPEKLNCIYGLHDDSEALFMHVCNRSELDRNLIILNNTKHLFKQNEIITQSKYHRFYYGFAFINNGQKLKTKVNQTKTLLIKGDLKRIFKILKSKLSIK